MSLYFITGNKNKFKEVSAVLPEIKQLDIDLPEIQEMDGREVVRFKLLEALKHKKGEFIVEDTSLSLNCLNGLPGPFIKWFLKSMGGQGLFELTKKLGNNKAQAKTIIAYAKNSQDIYYFEGLIKGEIVRPKMESNFGWDPIFKPLGSAKTFAELGVLEKNKISMRRKALNKFKKFYYSV